MEQFEKILVMRGGALGDFILTLPALAALREKFPHARLEILGYPRNAELAVAWHLADAARGLESPSLAGYFVSEGDLNDEWSSYFASFDLIVSYIFDPERIFQTNVAQTFRGSFIPGPHRPDEGAALHASEAFLTPLRLLGIADAHSVFRVLPHHRNPSADSLLAVHPGSGSDRKNWPEPRWKDLLQQLASTTALRFLIIGGEAEGEKAARLAAALPPTRTELAVNLSLIDLAQRMKACDFFLGHDSGITHLAAALGSPGLVLWGESNFEIWRPRNEKMRFLRAGPQLHELSVQVVLAEIPLKWQRR